MSDAARLLDAIREFPEEDTPRLAYADEVQADDPARAALIRKQVYRSAGQPAAWKTGPLRIRRWFRPWWPGRSCRSYYNSDWDLLVARVRPVEEVGPGDCFYVRRGFIDEVRLSAAAFLEHAAAIFAHPVTRVVLSDKRPFEPRNDSPGVVTWFAERYDETMRGPNLLPDAIYDAMIPAPSLDPRGSVLSSDRNLCRVRSKRDAELLLSAACVEFGRRAHAIAHVSPRAGGQVGTVG